MVEVWILLIYLSPWGPAQSPSVETQEFNSRGACEVVERYIKDKFHDRVVAACFKK